MATIPQTKEHKRDSRPQLITIQRQFGDQAADLAQSLSRSVRGEVRFDAASRALYATDLSIYRHVPIGVVIPRDADDVIATVATCRAYDVPILGRGCATSLAGQCCNVAVVIDFSKYMNAIREVDPHNRTALVEPGVICDELRHAAGRHQLTLAPDPATHKYCTLGGMIGNNSCGVHSMMGGKTVDNLEELEILTYDGLRVRVGRPTSKEFERAVHDGGRLGEIYSRLREIRDRYGEEVRRTYPRIPRRVSGYNLDQLLPENDFNVARSLVGSESTLALILGARLKLVHNPAARALVVIGYPDLGTAGDHVPEILRFNPIGLEGFHKHVIDNMRTKGKQMPAEDMLPSGKMWLMVEFGGESQKEANAQAEAVLDRLRALPGDQDSRVIEKESDQKALWYIRESGVGASRVPGEENAWPSWEDTAVHPDKLGNYLRDFSDLVQKKFNYSWTVFGHFGQGCIHTRITFDLKTREGVAKFRDFMEAGADLVVRYGGSLSGEHGTGQAKGELMPKMFGPELMQAFREFKSIWDPQWRMNPGKLIDARPLDEDIRVGPGSSPRPVFTHFKFPEDHGKLSLATERCFGVGKCRSLEGETMCPSFRVTREEKHSTRGRAHLLFEMLRGDSILDGWRDEGVKDALDLCLSCKGCKGDCPVSVDLATYKAEFLSHYWEGRLRSRSAYAFGLIDTWAKAASRAPGIMNLITQTPGLSAIAKLAAGMPSQRQIPSFAPRSFQQWFRERSRQNGHAKRTGRARVVLWPDTFTNYFHPDVGQAAVEVLERAGFEVALPRQSVCCGRPLYDFGMLDRAKRYLQHAIDTLDDTDSTVPVVVLEPSCASVFRDELNNILAGDKRAGQLSQRTFLLGEFLDKFVPDFSPPKFNGARRANVHGHCHQKAVMNMDSELKWLERLGIQPELVDSGCCGMAGSFGFEKDKYEVSVKCGEHVLLPKVRQADPKALIVANGFSCQEQISQLTNRHALHLAQVMQMAFHPEIERGPNPETVWVERRQSETSSSIRRPALALAGALALGIGIAFWAFTRRSA